MEDNYTEQQEIDFSIISPGNDKPKELDFSVNDLLENPNIKSNLEKPLIVQQIAKKEELAQGSFMKDLEKMQKQLSYQTIPYDIYEPQDLGQFTGTFEAKQQDTCTRTTNNMTKLCEKSLENDFKHLILDFTQQKQQRGRGRESFEDYYQTEILTTKKINDKVQQGYYQQNMRINKAQKNSRSKLKASNSSTGLLKSRNSSKLTEIQGRKSPTNELIRNTDSKKKSIGRSSNSRINGQNQESRSKSVKKPQKNTCKNSTRLQSEVYSEYYGFETKVQAQKKKKNTKKSLSKGKKIVYSNKNVNLYN